MSHGDFLESDNLNLKTFSFDKDTIYSNDDAIRNLKDENGRLMKLLHEKDFEIKKLKRDAGKSSIIKDVSNIDKSVSSEGMAAMKIMELSKKLREATAELESWKTKYFQQAKENKHRENELIQLRSQKTGAEVRKEPTNETFEELRLVRDKLRTADARVLELLNANQKLSKDMKIATKVLEDELGDPNLDVGKLLNNPSGWRGRAQKITALSEKVDKLQRQLREIEESGGGKSVGRDIPSGATSIGLASLHSGASGKSTDRQNDVLARMQRERQQNQLRLEQDNQRLTDDHAKLKLATDSVKSRNQSLAADIKAHKQQIKNMLDKAKNDDELIASLLQRQGQLQSTIQSLVAAAGHKDGNGHAVDAIAGVAVTHRAHCEHAADDRERQRQEMTQRDLVQQTGEGDSDQSKATEASFQIEIARLRTMAAAHDSRLQRLVERSTVLDEENSQLRHYCLQLEKDIQKLSPSKFKSKLHPATGTIEQMSDARLLALLSTDAAPTKEVLGDLQAAVLLKMDKIDSLNVALELMTAAKQEDVAILTDIIDQTRQKFVATITKLKTFTNENQI